MDALVGQTTPLRDSHTGASARYRVTKAWKQDGMIVVRLEPVDTTELDSLTLPDGFWLPGS